MTQKMDHGRRAWTPGDVGRFKLSGGVLRVPKTPAERLALYVKLAKLKADFLRRQREAAHNDGH